MLYIITAPDGNVAPFTGALVHKDETALAHLLGKYQVRGFDGGGRGTLLGGYSSEARAREVISQIIRALESNLSIYRMPKE